jgi:drug/metabolite transporter (DMT)-like permease
MTDRQESPYGAYLLLSTSMMVVGGYVALSKPLVAVFPVFLLAWLRFAIGAVFLLPWTFKDRGTAGQDATQLSRSQKQTLFWQSFFGNFLFSICMLSGVARTSAAAAGVILAAIPAATAIFAWLILREHIGARARAAIALAVVGVGLLSLAKSGGEVTMVGNALMLAAMCCEALYVVFGRRLVNGLSPMRVSALINLCGLLLMTPFGLWQALHFDWAGPSGVHWLGLIAYAFAASVLTVALWMAGLKRIPANQAGVFTVALPISAALVGAVVLKQPIGAIEWIALAIAASGIVVMTVKRA